MTAAVKNYFSSADIISWQTTSIVFFSVEWKITQSPRYQPNRCQLKFCVKTFSEDANKNIKFCSQLHITGTLQCHNVPCTVSKHLYHHRNCVSMTAMWPDNQLSGQVYSEQQNMWPLNHSRDLAKMPAALQLTICMTCTAKHNAGKFHMLKATFGLSKKNDT